MGVFPSVPGQAQPGRDTPGQPGQVLPPPQPTIGLTAQPGIPMPIAGYGYQQGDMALLWAYNAAFYQQRVVFRATQTVTATTLPHASSGVVTTIAFDTILEDPYSGWAATTANQWTAPFSGWYQVTLTVWVAAPGATETVLQPYISTVKSPGNAANGKTLTAVVIPNDIAGAEGTWVCYLQAGDTVYGQGQIKNSSSDVLTNLTAGTTPAIEVVWLT